MGEAAAEVKAAAAAAEVKAAAAAAEEKAAEAPAAPGWRLRCQRTLFFSGRQ